MVPYMVPYMANGTVQRTGIAREPYETYGVRPPLSAWRMDGGYAYCDIELEPTLSRWLRATSPISVPDKESDVVLLEA